MLELRKGRHNPLPAPTPAPDWPCSPSAVLILRSAFSSLPQDFVVSGTASEKLFGMAESLWEPNLAPEDLFETVSQTLLNAVDRDAYSGWGAVVWIIEKDKVTKRTLKARMD